MKLSSFRFDLPHHLIASYPTPNREDARLMVVDRATGNITHHSFKEFANFFEKDDVLVLNDTKVFRAQLDGYKEKTKAAVEVLLLRELDAENHLWDTWIEPARKIRVGNKLCFGYEQVEGVYTGDDLVAEVIDNTTSRGRTLRFFFEGDGATLHEVIYELGKTPLPKILQRKADMSDKERYQTVYATKKGSVVAPSAGFHFTPYLLKYLELKDVHMPRITLHLGLDTLKLLEAEDLGKYRIHSEPFSIPASTADIVNRARETGHKVCAVGTSSLKALESSISSDLTLQPIENGWTNKLLHPPYNSQIANALLTNFHVDRSIGYIETLAFAGHELTMDIYSMAIAHEYRFFVYGDALLIL